MQILLPVDVARRLVKMLRRRGLTEIGGVLMGEHVSAEEFRIVDFTVQHAKGTFASFLRLPQMHVRSLERFFRRTGDDYHKFNYLGEWHSHPAFSTRPSGSDLMAMHALVNDAGTGATFAVLMIVRLDQGTTLQAGTYLFLPNSLAVHVIPAVLESDQSKADRLGGQPPTSTAFSSTRKGGALIAFASNPDFTKNICDADSRTVSARRGGA